MKKIIEEHSASRYEILTPTGYRPLKSVMKTVEYSAWVVEFEDGLEIRCADEHKLILHSGEEIFVRDMLPGDKIRSVNGFSRVKKITDTGSQENMFDIEIDSDYHLYFTNDLVSHNTTTAAAYFLYEVIFNRDMQFAILANKFDTAKEILDRFKMMFEYLPVYIKPGVVEWNKSSVEFSNGCKIFASATSSSSIRGRSLNCVVGCTEVVIQDENGTVRTETMESLYSSENIVSDEFRYSSRRNKVLSEDSVFRNFQGMKRELVDNIIELYFDDNTFLYLTPEHEIFKDGSYVEAKYLKVGDYVHSTAGKKTIIYKEVKKDKQQFVYDFVNIEETNNFFANDTLIHQCVLLDEFAHIDNADEFFASTFPVISSGKNTKVIITSTPNGMNLFYKIWTDAINKKNTFAPIKFGWEAHPKRDEAWHQEMLAIMSPEQFDVEFNAEFYGSTNTLLSPTVLRRLTFSDPLENLSNAVFKVYEEPTEGNSYIITVDTAEGIGKDYTVATIFDITNQPFRQVAVYRSNTISISSVSEILMKLCKSYNEAYLIIETNGVGKSVADAMYYEYEYENMLISKIDDGEAKVSFKMDYIGLRQTMKTKRIGCATLKTLIENNILLIQDFETVQELSNFIKKGNTYQADKKKTDDIVMTLVMFAWLTDQPFFEELTNENIRSEIRGQINHEDSMLPFFFDDGHSEEDEMLDELYF